MSRSRLLSRRICLLHNGETFLIPPLWPQRLPTVLFTTRKSSSWRGKAIARDRKEKNTIWGRAGGKTAYRLARDAELRPAWQMAGFKTMFLAGFYPADYTLIV